MKAPATLLCCFRLGHPAVLCHPHCSSNTPGALGGMAGAACPLCSWARLPLPPCRPCHCCTESGKTAASLQLAGLHPQLAACRRLPTAAAPPVAPLRRPHSLPSTPSAPTTAITMNGLPPPDYTLNEAGERVIAGSRRPDGTLRKERRVRAGYVAQDEQAVYVSRGAAVSCASVAYKQWSSAVGRTAARETARRRCSVAVANRSRLAPPADQTKRAQVPGL